MEIVDGSWNWVHLCHTIFISPFWGQDDRIKSPSFCGRKFGQRAVDIIHNGFSLAPNGINGQDLVAPFDVVQCPIQWLDQWIHQSWQGAIKGEEVPGGCHHIGIVVHCHNLRSLRSPVPVQAVATWENPVQPRGMASRALCPQEAWDCSPLSWLDIGHVLIYCLGQHLCMLMVLLIRSYDRKCLRVAYSLVYLCTVLMLFGHYLLIWWGSRFLSPPPSRLPVPAPGRSADDNPSAAPA